MVGETQSAVVEIAVSTVKMCQVGVSNQSPFRMGHSRRVHVSASFAEPLTRPTF